MVGGLELAASEAVPAPWRLLIFAASFTLQLSTAAVVVNSRALFKQLLRSRCSRPLTAQDSEWDEADPDDEARTSRTRSRAQPVAKSEKRLKEKEQKARMEAEMAEYNAQLKPVAKPVLLDCD